MPKTLTHHILRWSPRRAVTALAAIGSLAALAGAAVIVGVIHHVKCGDVATWRCGQGQSPAAALAPLPNRQIATSPNPTSLAAISAAMGLDAAHVRLHPGFDPSLACTCATDRLTNGWCWRCNVGYIAGTKITCAKLFETLDPHGHDLNPQSLQLAPCQDMIHNDGYCDAVGIGFVGGKAYFTRLTYGLACGKAVDPVGLTCDVCRANSAETGWCEKCQRGMVGNVTIADRAIFDRTASEYRNFLKAIDKSRTCEMCGCAMVVHRVCPTCLISYEQDVPVQLSRTGAVSSSPTPSSGP